MAGPAGLVAVLALAAGTARAEPAQPIEAPADAEWKYPGSGLLFYPAGPGEGEQRWAVGGVWQLVPQFMANFRYGLPLGFSVDARLLTILIRNELDVGAAWATRAGPFHVGAMLHAGAWVGLLGESGFSTEFHSTGWGVMVDPGLFAGLQVARDSWLTLQVETYLAPYQAANLGGLVITPRHAAVYNGVGASLIVEYFIGKGVVYYGASLYNTTQNYPAWVALTYSRKMISYGGVLAGYEF